MASLQDVLTALLTAAQQEAGEQWASAKHAVVSEMEIFAQRLAQIKAGHAAGELTQEDARDFFAMMQNNMVAMIAMATTLVWAAVQRIINAALAAARDAINSFVNFPLFI